MFGGLLICRRAWTLTWPGYLLVFSLLAASAIFGLRALYPFLAITAPVSSPVLVIDGWMPTVDLEAAGPVYRQGNYRMVLVVRAYYDFTAIDGDPGNLGYVRTVLVRAGIPDDRIYGVLFTGLRKDRTFFSAKAVGEWFTKHHLPLSSLDLLTLGPHARRSRYLYRRALGSAVSVGALALPDPAYEGEHWWRFSDGVREVLFEAVAYFYVRWFFVPPAL